ncbi:MAG: S41 family peptidase [bacterium]|nr:S41 family peptidase [bacterium]
MSKLFVILFLALFASAPAYSAVTEEECSKDSDCVKYYAELGNANFEILREIRNLYVDAIDFEKLVSEFRNGGIKQVFSLLDPHSEYVTAAELAKKNESRKPFGGVGIAMGESDKKIMVAGLIEGGPAIKSGKIKKGDIILAVGEKSTEGVSRDTVVGWIRGGVGTDVVLKFGREGAVPPEFTVTLRRELIEHRILTSKVFGDAGYINLREFRAGVSSEIYEIISAFPKNVTGLVLDLRGNPGGLLTEANRLSSIFLERTKLIEKIVTRKRVEQNFAAGSRSVFREQIKLPLIVLVDEFSASASEIVAAALQDNRRAVIVGVPTFGKALVQSTYNCYVEDPDWKVILQGDCFQITTGRIYRPNGRTLQGKGAFPDIIMVNGEAEDIEKMLDRKISESTLKGHFKGDEEGMLTQDEKAKLDLLKEDRQLYVALEILKIMSGKAGL